MEHIVSIRNRRVVDIQASSGDLDGHRVVQGNAGVDVLRFKLDAEWRDFPSYSVIFEMDGVASEYAAEMVNNDVAITIPSAVLENTGKLRFSLKALDADNVVRLLTESAGAFLTVMASGPIDGAEGHEDELTRLETALEQAEDLTEVDVTVTEITGGHRVTLTNLDGSNSFDVMDGVDGAPGQPGQPGASGRDGVSPSASVAQTETGATITITDAVGTTTADIANGQDGNDGNDGDDGITPIVTVTDISGGHRVTFSYGTGDPRNVYFDVMDGDGGGGGGGHDGITPQVIVTPITGGHNVAFFYASGDARNTNFDVIDGVDGDDGTNGTDGITPTISVTSITGGHTIAFSYGSGDPRNTSFNVMDGVDGDDGNDYVITQGDYIAIANVVYGMLTNADALSY